MAQLHFTHGAMGSGKSLQLMNMAGELKRHELPFMVMKPKVDTKAGNAITSRVLKGVLLEADVLYTQENNLRDTITNELGKRGLDTFARVLVDEAQFSTPAHIDQLLEVAIKDDIEVRAFGLRTDFQTKFFPGSQRLMEQALQITELETTCRCGGYGVNNARKINGQFVFAGDQVAIHTDEVDYEALCRECYTGELTLFTQSLAK